MLEEIMSKFDDINYGYLYKGIDIYPHKKWNKKFNEIYKLQINNELEKTKYGVCWDQVELERYYFEKANLNFNSYFIVNDDNKKYETHTFIIVNLNNKYYWFEHSFEKYRGIHEFNSLEDALKHIKDVFIKWINDDTNILIYEYEKPNKHLTCNEFYDYCQNGKEVKI